MPECNDARSVEHAETNAFGRTITPESHLSPDIQPTRHPLTENITPNIRWRTSPAEKTFQTDEWRGWTLECGVYLIDGDRHYSNAGERRV